MIVLFVISSVVYIALHPISHINTHYSSWHNTSLFLSVLLVLIFQAIRSILCTCRVCSGVSFKLLTRMTNAVMTISHKVDSKASFVLLVANRAICFVFVCLSCVNQGIGCSKLPPSQFLFDTSLVTKWDK